MLKNAPILNLSYWITLVAASIVGANLGDFVAHGVEMSEMGALFTAAGAFALAVAIGRIFGGSAWIYWAAMLALRWGATNLADSTHEIHLGFAVSIPVSLAALVVCALMLKRPWQGTGRDAVGDTSALHWLMMLLAGTAGTLLGDWLSYDGLLVRARPIYSALEMTLMFGAALGVLLVMAGKRTATHAALFWGAVVLVMAVGTTAADAFGQYVGQGIGTIVTAVLLLVLMGVLYRQGTGRPAV